MGVVNWTLVNSNNCLSECSPRDKPVGRSGGMGSQFIFSVWEQFLLKHKINTAIPPARDGGTYCTPARDEGT